jgi:hypothetical protein
MNLTAHIASLIICALLCGLLATAQTSKVIVISGPTVIAFFPSVTEKELLQDPDTNESLSDFQVYARRVRTKLYDAGIDFHEVYATSFSIKCGAKTKNFHPQKIQVGYYFIAPGKSARVEYGVMTDADILQVAKEYFRSASK